MKPTTHLLAALSLAAAALALAEEPRKPVYRDAETHELIAKKLKVNQEIDPIQKLVPSEGADPSKVNQPKNLIDSSDVISFNGYTTLVPKLAIIQLPELYADRINNHRLENKVVGWGEFYRLNQGWITTVEVSRVQAEGKEALAEAVSENLSKSRNLVIATYSAGPISMLPPKLPTDEVDPETADVSTQPTP